MTPAGEALLERLLAAALAYDEVRCRRLQGRQTPHRRRAVRAARLAWLRVLAEVERESDLARSSRG